MAVVVVLVVVVVIVWVVVVVAVAAAAMVVVLLPPVMLLLLLHVLHLCVDFCIGISNRLYLTILAFHPPSSSLVLPAWIH